MSYYDAVRQAGMCANVECEENDYIYDAPHLSPEAPYTARGTSFYEIEHRVLMRGGPHAGVNHRVTDSWEDRLLSIAA